MPRSESGPSLRSGTRENAEQTAERLLDQLSLPKSQFRALQDAPFDMIIGAQGASKGRFGPFVDGEVVPRDPFDPTAPAVSADVPLLAGSNLQDLNLMRTDFSIDDAAAQKQLAAHFKAPRPHAFGPRTGRRTQRHPPPIYAPASPATIAFEPAPEH